MKLPLSLASIVSMLYVLASAKQETRREDRITHVTERVGGPHGHAFDDLQFVNATLGHRRISKVTIGLCVPKKRITYLAFDFKDYRKPSLPVVSVEHGKLGKKYAGKTVSLTVNPEDFIINIILRTYMTDVGWSFHTRLGHVSLQTKFGGPPVKCGYYDNSDPEFDWYADKGQALLYLSGASGDAVDFIKGHFIATSDY